MVNTMIQDWLIWNDLAYSVASFFTSSTGDGIRPRQLLDFRMLELALVLGF